MSKQENKNKNQQLRFLQEKNVIKIVKSLQQILSKQIFKFVLQNT